VTPFKLHACIHTYYYSTHQWDIFLVIPLPAADIQQSVMLIMKELAEAAKLS
jgi:hypothetical protein